jgi:orotate phosphoribosyltransferase
MEQEQSQGIEELSRMLLKTGCLRFGTFKLSSGALSPYYVDLRLIPSDPEAFRKVIGYYSSVIQGEIAERSHSFAGIPTAGIAYGAVLAFNHRKPFLYVRREAKEHGTGRRIEGRLFPGVKVLILDDVVTSGSNLVNAIDAIRTDGGIVEDAVVLLDRQQGGAISLEKTGVKLHSFATISRICEILRDNGTIDESHYNQILDQIGSGSGQSSDS